MLTGFFFTFSLLFCESHEIAKKAEEADWQENEKNEHYIVISGLEDETPGGLDQKDQFPLQKYSIPLTLRIGAHLAPNFQHSKSRF